jgi:hypothetical protein
MKKIKEGKTNQKTLVDSALTFSTSFVSTYSQSIASSETNGTEANSAPANELRFAISEIVTIKIVVIAIFVT